MTKRKTKVSQSTTERLTIIRHLVMSHRALLRLAVETKDKGQSEALGEAFEKVGEVLAAIRKPLQPTPHTHGPLSQE